MTSRLVGAVALVALTVGFCATAHADFAWPSSGKVTIPSGETYTATEADMANVNALSEIAFADETSKLVFTGQTAPKNVQFSGLGTIVKDSDYDWTMETTQPGGKFRGKFVLKGGVVTPTAVTPFCSGEYQNAGSLWIEDGATLCCEQAMKNTQLLNWTEVHIAGDGKEVDGVNKGAIWVKIKDGTGTKDVRVVILEADASICTDGVNYYYYHNGSLDLNGHVLTVTGVGDYYFANCAISGGGKIRMPTSNATRTFCIREKTEFAVGDDGVLTRVELGDKVELVYRESNAETETTPVQNAELLVSGNVLIYHYHQGDIPQGEYADHVVEWAGPVKLKDASSTLALTAGSANCMIKVSGCITGPGNVFAKNSVGRVYLSNPTNDFAGTLTASQSDSSRFSSVALGSSNSVPDYASVTISKNMRASLMVKSDDSSWKSSDVARFAREATFDASACLGLDTSESPSGKFTLLGVDWASVGKPDLVLTSDGTGELTVTGPLDGYDYPLCAMDGTLRLTGPDTIRIGPTWAGARSSRHPQESGAILIEDAADVRLGDKMFTIAAPTTATEWQSWQKGAVTIRNSHFTDAQKLVLDSVADGGGIYVGRYGEGTLTIESGSVVTSKVAVGSGGENSRGAVYQRGGDVVLSGGYKDAYRNRASYIGHYGHGYYELSGGTCRLLGQFPIGRSQGVFALLGGEATVAKHFAADGADGRIYLANEKNGMLYLKNGTFTNEGDMLVGYSAGYNAAITLDGPNAHFVQTTSDKPITVGYAAGGTFNINLNAGVFELADGIQVRSSDYSANPIRTYLNFNGGTLKAFHYKSILNQNVAKGNLSYITVYAGGMTAEIRGQAKVLEPIEQATGNGVVSVPLPDGLADMELTGSPYIFITGGGGICAQAYADFDSQTKRVTGVHVICPGRDYETAPTATFKMGDIELGTSVCAIAPNKPGSLIKTGDGMLKLQAANSYKGETVLREGTLSSEADGALPAGTTVVFAGGKLNMNNTKTGDGGAMPLKFRVDAGQATEAGTVTYPDGFTFADGSVLTVSGVGDLDEAVKRLTVLSFSGAVEGVPQLAFDGKVENPDDWHLRWVAGKVKLSRTSGMMLIVR